SLRRSTDFPGSYRPGPTRSFASELGTLNLAWTSEACIGLGGLRIARGSAGRQVDLSSRTFLTSKRRGVPEENYDSWKNRALEKINRVAHHFSSAGALTVPSRLTGTMSRAKPRFASSQMVM